MPSNSGWLGPALWKARCFGQSTATAELAFKPLSGGAVCLVVKERVHAVGIDPSGYSGHSLRAGLATSAAQAGVPSWKIRQQTGHASDAMLARYIRDGELFIQMQLALCFEVTWRALFGRATPFVDVRSRRTWRLLVSSPYWELAGIPPAIALLSIYRIRDENINGTCQLVVLIRASGKPY